jgi:hypothetical protein
MTHHHGTLMVHIITVMVRAVDNCLFLWITFNPVDNIWGTDVL